MKKDHLEIILEDIQSKFELVLKGHDALRKEIRDAREESNQKHDHTAFLIQVLNKKIDEVDGRLSKKIDDVDARLSMKIDGVAADLSAHRRDTEAHRADYGIREKKD
jgi:predicted PilT family ATPase